jgi:hypothetical protein
MGPFMVFSAFRSSFFPFYFNLIITLSNIFSFTSHRGSFKLAVDDSLFSRK